MLKKLFGVRCAICKKKEGKYSNYLDDSGNKIKVCYKCLTYAERRALRKI